MKGRSMKPLYDVTKKTIYDSNSEESNGNMKIGYDNDNEENDI